MSNLSTFYPAPITAADLGLGAGSNATFGSIQNTPIGSTTPSTGAFTTLNANNGTLTASAPVLDLAQTWNNAAVTFTAFRLNVTNTASNSASRLFDIQRGGTSLWGVNAGGDFISSTNGVNARSVFVGVFGPADISISSNTAAIRLGVIDDTNLQREGTGILAQRSATTAQTFRLYNTFTDANNHERGFMRWSSNVLQIGTEKAGTGSVRNLEFQTDGTTRVRIQNEGLVVPNGALFMQNSSIDGQGDSNASIRLTPFSTGHVIITTGLLRMHGSSSSFPALKRSSTTLQVRLADDSAFAPLEASTFSNYNSFTDSNNFERGFFRWSSSVLQVGTEKLGTGAARQLDLQVDGITRMAFPPTGSWAQILASGQSVVTNNIGILHIKSSNGATIPQLVLHANTTTSGHEATIGFGATASDTSAADHKIACRRGSSLADSDFVFSIAGNERFRIKSDGLIQFQGTTSSFPAIKRSSAILQARLADDSAYTTIDALHRLQGTAPATSGATGTAGDIRYDADYIYVCTAANTWKRAAIATW